MVDALVAAARAALLAGVLGGVFPQQIHAQRVNPLRALELNAWDAAGGGYRYIYRLHGPARAGVWGVVEMDITVPRRAGEGVIASVGGRWLGDDAMALNRDTTWGRVPMEVTIPPEWYGYTTSHGTLVWTAQQRNFGNETNGVKPRDVLDGLTIRSTGVPSLREVEILPRIPIFAVDEALANRQLNALPVERGMIIGPGRPAAFLSFWSLADEVRRWCISGGSSREGCEEWRRAIAGGIRAARLGAGGVLSRQWEQIDRLLLRPDLQAAAKRVLGEHVRLLRTRSAAALLWDVPAGI
jgi:hypothetical protein